MNQEAIADLILTTPFTLGEVARYAKEMEQRLQRLEALLVFDIDFPFKKLHPDATLPAKAGEKEACYDFTCVADENFLPTDCVLGLEKGVQSPFVEMRPGDSRVFKLGIAAAIPEGRALFYWDRSGMGAKRNLHRLAGVIDSTYRGEWMVCLTNHSRDVQIIEAGDKIIQGHLALVLPGTPKWVDDLPESYRGEAGFGSTGR